MKKFYDYEKDALVYLGTCATPEFWDTHWKTEDLRRYILNQDNNLVVKCTKDFLAEGSKILEGGCGRGDKVYSLMKNAYDVYGIDFAKDTVAEVNKVMPELKIVCGDVFSLPYDDNSFDGYWSLGVVEHFYCGYDGIVKEINRVVKSGGYVFVTVPALSLLRKLKAKFKLYEPFGFDRSEPEDFYQFALDPDIVIETFINSGFQLRKKFFIDGMKGIKDEIFPNSKVFSKVYCSKGIFYRLIRKLINVTLSFWAGHCCLFVFERK